MQGTTRLWYTTPAKEWAEALPIGNGRIGAMAFGGISRERLALNEDTLWSGYPRDHARAGAKEALARAQALMLEGKLAEAQKVIEQDVTSDCTQAYMPLGDIWMDFPGLSDEADGYIRSLDMETGLHATAFAHKGVRYERECFVSHPDQALLYRLTADAKGAISFDLSIDTQLRKLEEKARETGEGKALAVLRALCPSHAAPKYIEAEVPFVYEDDPAKKGVRFQAICDVECEGGEVYVEDGRVRVRGADSACLRFTCRTSFNGFSKMPWLEGRDCEAEAEADAQAVRKSSYEEIKARHIEDFANLMRRCDFHLNAPKIDMSTLDRLISFADTQNDPALYELVFQFGRYLTVSASRPGTTATNLQGIWNDSMRPPWSSNYTININTEMNYWPAEATNLSELTEPLFSLIDALQTTGRNTARDFYGARGAVSHHNADLWALSNPVGERHEGCMVWAFWPMSFGWLCRHLFDHYQYTRDEVFLREKTLPALRDAVRFFCDALREDGNGYLSIYPATSPENHFSLGEERSLCGAKNATMQDAILREVFGEYLRTLEILDLSEPMADEARAALSRIRPYQIGSKGQLLEWTEEYEEPEPHHRHQSHLYPLHPSDQITENTPELLNACRRTLELRGDEGTGWSLGWKINLWARLNEGAHALSLLKMQLRLVGEHNIHYSGGGGTYPNLFDAHPPFQIDGNFGATAGIAEMLLRSRPGECRLLPALPEEWPNGEITGLRAMGALTVDIQFESGTLKKARILAERALKEPVEVTYRGKTLAVVKSEGEYEIDP